MIPDVYPKTHARILGAFIAGGYAVSPVLASDLDVWVRITAEGSLERTKQDILAYLNDQYGLDRVTPLDDLRETGEHFQDAYKGAFESLHVANVRVGAGLAYHVMVTHGDLQDIINSFDLSICQVGIDELGMVHTGEEWTDTTMPILVVKDTPTTLERMLKYGKRFNVAVDWNYLRDKREVAQFEEDHLGVVADKTPEWCGESFLQGPRVFDCRRELHHTGPHDSPLAQDIRWEASSEVNQ